MNDTNELLQKNYSRHQFIQKVYPTNPLIHSILKYWEIGHCTFEEALQKMVLELLAENDRLNKIVMKEAFISRPRKELSDFVIQMEIVMAENDKEKGDSWKRMPISDLDILLAKQENIKNNQISDVESHRKRLLNMSIYCMMLHHRLGER